MTTKFVLPLGGHTLTVLRAPLITDTDNTKYRDWLNAVQTVLVGCEVQPFLLSSRLSVEIETYREYSSTLYRVWAPPAFRPVYTDRLLWNGVIYEVDAEPSIWSYSDGTPSHLNFLMRLRSG